MARAGTAKKKRAGVRTPGGTPPRRARVDKLSISLAPDNLQWLTGRAKRLGTSVSAVVAAAIGDQRRAEACADLLELLGGADDISDADIAALRREAFAP